MDISISSFFTILSNFVFSEWIGTIFPLPLSPKTRRIEADKTPESLLRHLEGRSDN